MEETKRSLGNGRKLHRIESAGFLKKAGQLEKARLLTELKKPVEMENVLLFSGKINLIARHKKRSQRTKARCLYFDQSLPAIRLERKNVVTKTIALRHRDMVDPLREFSLARRP